MKAGALEEAGWTERKGRIYEEGGFVGKRNLTPLFSVFLGFTRHLSLPALGMTGQQVKRGFFGLYVKCVGRWDRFSACCVPVEGLWCYCMKPTLHMKPVWQLCSQGLAESRAAGLYENIKDIGIKHRICELCESFQVYNYSWGRDFYACLLYLHRRGSINYITLHLYSGISAVQHHSVPLVQKILSAVWLSSFLV